MTSARRRGTDGCERAAPGHGAETFVEFALVAPILLILLMGAIQLMVIGAVALSIQHAAVSGARYAAINPDADQSAVDSYLRNTIPSFINDGNLSMAMVPASGNRATGTQVSVSVSYALGTKLFLGKSFMGIEFPDHLQSVATMPSE